LRWWLEPYVFELQARWRSAGPASQRGLRQPLCGRADCGNPALPPPKGCEQCLGEQLSAFRLFARHYNDPDYVWLKAIRFKNSEVPRKFFFEGVTKNTYLHPNCTGATEK
jgi:hypothetical protein